MASNNYRPNVLAKEVELLRDNPMLNCAAHAIDLYSTPFSRIHDNMKKCGNDVTDNQLRVFLSCLSGNGLVHKYIDETYSLTRAGMDSVVEVDKFHLHAEYYNTEDNIHKNKISVPLETSIDEDMVSEYQEIREEPELDFER
jgi:hypothetical protein